MIHSIRHFLLISLLVSITIASSITAIGNYLLDNRVIQPFLDEHLLEIFAFVEAVSQPLKNTNKSPHHFPIYFNPFDIKHILFQVWAPDGKIVLSSANSKNEWLANVPNGFSDRQIKGDDWRIYSEKSAITNNKIVVAELYNIRNQLADEITQNNAYILVVTYPVFGILIWIIVGLALRSITRVSNAISNRAFTYLEPLESDNIPIEIEPLVAELNQLFVRLHLAFERNKRFAADAAHELRTPLAALKTHTQIAIKATNEKDRQIALQKMVKAVDRSSHVVTQLLTLSRLSQEETLQDMHPIDLHKLAAEIIAYLAPMAIEKNIEIELMSPPDETIIMGNDTVLGILIRNIVDNAIRYTPSSGAVKIEIILLKKQIVFRVTDTGPGIPDELRERVFERFFRVLGNKASGSGLGLAIVSQIAGLHQAQVYLSTPPNGIGLQFDVIFSAYSA